MLRLQCVWMMMLILQCVDDDVKVSVYVDNDV